MKLLIFGLAICVVIGCKKDKDPSVPGGGTASQDSVFVIRASINNYTSIQLAHVAGTVSSEPAITAFAGRIVAENTVYRQQLIDLADSMNYYSADSLDSAHVILRSYLLTLSGRQFDSVYIHSQVSDISAQLSNHHTEISSGNNSSLKTFAGNYLPDLQSQKNLADSIAAEY